MRNTFVGSPAAGGRPRPARLAPAVGKRPRQARRKPGAAVQHRSESTEDHLERIQELVDQKGFARVSDIAAALALSRSAVSNMVRRLARRGFLNYEKYRGLTLTREGRAVANHIKVRHETLAALLQLLGLSAGTVDQEVEAIEHALRPDTLRVFTKLVGFWQTHPEELQALLDYSPEK
ncbi:MAG: iron dependent repressor, metal binding and dimerization domain protein [Verrucomicrobiota bacterium]